MQVKEDDRSVILSTNVLFGVQSIKMKEDGLTGMYYDYALAAPLMTGVMEKENMDILILGMGTGTYANQCMKYFQNATIEGVEIDQKITNLAGTYFDLPKEASVTTYDGRAYLQAIDKKYDVIMVDAYQDITIPFQMSSVEFFMLVKESLREGGVMVVNMNMKSGGDGGINAYLADTIASVFPHVYTVDVKGATNRELFASENENILTLLSENKKYIVQEELTAMTERIKDNLIPYESTGKLLTDDKAPVEVLGMRVIDELIQDEIGYYKDIFRKQGLEGLLKSL